MLSIIKSYGDSFYKMKMPYDAAITLLGTFLRGITCNWIDICTLLFIETLFIMVNTLRPIKLPTDK